MGADLYVADTNNHKILKLADSGLSGSADATGAAAKFNAPSGITTDGFSLFVTDTDNHTIRKIE